MFGHDWQKVEGRVISWQSRPGWEKAHSSNVGAGPRQFVVEYSFDGEDAKRVMIEISPEKIWLPSTDVGASVPILVDRTSSKAKFDVADPRLDPDVMEAAEDAEADAMQAEAEGMLRETLRKDADESGS